MLAPDRTPIGVARHSLARVLVAALDGAYPPADGGWEHLPGWRPDVGAIVSLTGHAYVCTTAPLDVAALDALGADGLGGLSMPRVVLAVTGPTPFLDCLDVLTLARGRAAQRPPLVPRPDLDEHPRLRSARITRDEVRAFGYPDARRDVVSVGRGLGGLLEIGVEAATPGRGSTLFADALATLPAEPVVAGIAPGNARSLRSALHAGFVVVGSVQVFRT